MKNGEIQVGNSIRYLQLTSYFMVQIPIQIVLEVWAKAIRPKEVKGIWTVKEETKLTLFSDNMIVYIENLKESTNISRIQWS
jgi:hypothetical protein